MVTESNPEPSHVGHYLGGQSHLFNSPHCHFTHTTDSAQPSAISEDSNPTSDLASDGLETIVTVTETLEELKLPQEVVESESRGAIYSIPIMEDVGGGSSTPEDPAEAPRTLQGNSNPSSRESLHLRGWGQNPSLILGLWRHNCFVLSQQLSGVRHLSCSSSNLSLSSKFHSQLSGSGEVGLRSFPLGTMGLFCLVSPLPHRPKLD